MKQIELLEVENSVIDLMASHRHDNKKELVRTIENNSNVTWEDSLRIKKDKYEEDLEIRMSPEHCLIHFIDEEVKWSKVEVMFDELMTLRIFQNCLQIQV